MGLMCVRAVEPGFDELPQRLKVQDDVILEKPRHHHFERPKAAYEIDALQELPIPVGHILRNGHDQSNLEANVEAWVLQQTTTLGNVLTGKPWPLQPCVMCTSPLPMECVGSAAGACTRFQKASVSSMHIDEGGYPPSPAAEPAEKEQVTAQFLPPVPGESPRQLPQEPHLSAPTRTSPNHKPLHTIRDAAELSAASEIAPFPAVPFTADGREDTSSPRHRNLNGKSRFCDALCCRQEIDIVHERVVPYSEDEHTQIESS